MPISYRTYVVDGDRVLPLAKKTFEEFFLRKRPVLGDYAGQKIVIATALYESKNRKPKKLIKVDCLRLSVLPDGSMDREEYADGLVEALDADRSGKGGSAAGGSVIDMSSTFWMKRRENRWQPKPSKEVIAGIRKHLGIDD